MLTGEDRLQWGGALQWLVRLGLAMALGCANWAVSAEEEIRFDIERFEVEQKLLPEAVVREVLLPFMGAKRSYDDVAKAREALETKLVDAGYTTVIVSVPDQDITQGVVRLEVLTVALGKMAVTGNTHTTEAQVRKSLPVLYEGAIPNMRAITDAVQFSNENSGRQAEVTFTRSETPGKIDARVEVTESKPNRFFATLDNTGNSATGKYRMGVAYQNGNLLGGDQQLTMAYSTSPDAPQGVRVDIYSAALRIPFYSVRGALDMVYGESMSSTPTTTQATNLDIVGKGRVYGLHWRQYLARSDEYSSQVNIGLDYKYLDTRCTVNGVVLPYAPPLAASPSCTPYTVQPFSVSYAGQRVRVGEAIEYSVGVSKNLPLGDGYQYNATDGGSGTDRYSFIAGNRPLPDSFEVVRGSGSYLRSFAQDWQVRVAANLQYSGTPLPNAEQIGLAGSAAVRGFNERAVVADSGYVANIEVTTPNWAEWMKLPGDFRSAGFLDIASGWTHYPQSPTGNPPSRANISSIGFGVRYKNGSKVSARGDLACITTPAPFYTAPGAPPMSNQEKRGDWYGHLSVVISF